MCPSYLLVLSSHIANLPSASCGHCALFNNVTTDTERMCIS